MRPTDIESLVTLSGVSLSPDGACAVFAGSRPSLAADRNVGQLWCVKLDGSVPRRITRGVADAAPTFSPDGTRIAFLRATDGAPQLHIMPACGGDAVRITEQHLGVEDFAWSPDGSRLAFVSRVPEAGRYGTVKELGPGAEAARRITGITWEANGVGYTIDRPRTLFVVASADPGDEPTYPAAPGSDDEPRTIPADPLRLSTEEQSVGAIAFAADGKSVLTTVSPREPQTPDLRDAVYAFAVDGSNSTEVLGTDANLSVSNITVAGDGQVALIAGATGESGTDFVAATQGLWLVSDRHATRLTDVESVDLMPGVLVAVGDDFVVADQRSGRVTAQRITRSGTISELITGDIEITSLDARLTGSGVEAVATVAQPDSLGELLHHRDGATAQVSDFGAAVRESGWVKPRELTITARDGSAVHGWLATPDEDGPHPTILMIHGGPYAQYGVHFFDEVQTLVTAGYAVAFCNPRGSQGYGSSHGRAIRQAMGTVDFTDVIDFLEGSIASDARLDGSRVGVMGGSYGGYLTAWTIAHDHRFAGAIVERGFLDPISFEGTSDIGSFFGKEYVGTDPEQIAAQSPMAQVGHVTTPTFVVHSELDFRCPLEQATRYYSALRSRGVPSEMLIFPGENHELSRSGRPRHRVQRFDAILDWWARYLPVTGE